MALETLKDTDRIYGVKIERLSEDARADWPNEYTPARKGFINIDDDQNIISFKIQNGPIKENGKNGCQVTDMIAVVKHIISQLNEKSPCKENQETITKLSEALYWQEERTRNREARNTEGTSNE